MSMQLKNLKFMQQILANEAKTPEASGEPPSKRQKLAINSPTTTVSPSSPSFFSPTTDGRSNNEFIKRQAEAAGDTEWYVDGYDAFPKTEDHVKVSEVGFSTIDADPSDDNSDIDDNDRDIRRMRKSGRRSFGKFNPDIEVSLRRYIA